MATQNELLPLVPECGVVAHPPSPCAGTLLTTCEQRGLPRSWEGKSALAQVFSCSWVFFEFPHNLQKSQGRKINELALQIVTLQGTYR